MQLLDLVQDVCTCCIVSLDSSFITLGESWKAIWVHLGPQGSWGRSPIFKSPWNLPCSALCAAVQGCCDEDDILQLGAQGSLAMYIGEVMGVIEEPIDREAAPAATDKSSGEGSIGT